MRISVSNIAWDLQEEDAVATLLRNEGIDRVDLAPGKYFPDPFSASPEGMARVKQLWEDRGFEVEGFQSLLFGTTGFNLFDDDDDRMLRHLAAQCRIGRGLGARALTFGSPRQRDRGNRTFAEAMEIAVPYFSRLGDVAAAEGVIVCLEPNPPAYGCNFMTSTDEAATVVSATAHPAIKLQLDVGAIAMNSEDATATIRKHASIIGHVHASEPHLAVLGDGGSPHAEAGAALREVRPDLTVTIEMAATKANQIEAVRKAVDVAKRAYGAE